MDGRPTVYLGSPAPSAIAGEVAQVRRWAEPHHPAPGHGHGFVGPGIPGHARPARGGVEHAEPPQHHTVAARMRDTSLLGCWISDRSGDRKALVLDIGIVPVSSQQRPQLFVPLVDDQRPIRLSLTAIVAGKQLSGLAQRSGIHEATHRP